MTFVFEIIVITLVIGGVLGYMAYEFYTEED
jgi:hypothetical protein